MTCEGNGDVAETVMEAAACFKSKEVVPMVIREAASAV